MEAKALKARVAECFEVDAELLPQRVFTPSFGSFGFLGYAVINRGYWSLLGRLGAWSRDDEVAVVSLDPDYVASSGGQGGALTIRLDADFEEYADAVNREFPVSLALVCVPPSQRWAIWGETRLSTLVVGFREEPKPSFEEMARASGLQPLAMEEILDIVKLDLGNYDSRIGGPAKPEAVRAWEEYAAEFRRNYSPGIRPGGAKQP